MSDHQKVVLRQPFSRAETLSLRDAVQHVMETSPLLREGSVIYSKAGEPLLRYADIEQLYRQNGIQH